MRSIRCSAPATRYLLDRLHLNPAAFGIPLGCAILVAMRKITMKTGLLTLWLACACLFAPVVYAAADVGQQNTIQVVTLDIQNMTCPLCRFTIKKALQNVNGVQRVTVDYDSKTAEVDFDPRQTDVQALIKASTDAGYPATARRISH